MPAVIVLGHQLEVFRSNDPIPVSDLQLDIRKYELSILHVQMVCRGDGRAGVFGGVAFMARFMERHVRGGLQLIVQDHPSNVLALSEQIGLSLARHPVQARVVPHLRRLDPTCVVHLADVTRVVAMVVEQRFAGVSDAHDVRDGAVPEACDGSALDQPLSLERREIRVRSSDIVDISLQVVREHRSVAARALEEIHFRSTQEI